MEKMDRIQSELDRIKKRIQEINALQKEALKENELNFYSDLDTQLRSLEIRQEILKTRLNELTLESYKKIKVFG